MTTPQHMDNQTAPAKLTSLGLALLDDTDLLMSVMQVIDVYFEREHGVQDEDRLKGHSRILDRLLYNEQHSEKFSYLRERGLDNEGRKHLRKYCHYALKDTWTANEQELKNVQKLKVSVQHEATFGDVNDDPETHLLQQESTQEATARLERMQAVLCTVSLPPKEAEYRALMLEGHTLKDIAATLDINVATARRRDYRVREKALIMWRQETFFESQPESDRDDLWALFQSLSFADEAHTQYRDLAIKGRSDRYIKSKLECTTHTLERLKYHVRDLVISALNEHRNTL